MVHVNILSSTAEFFVSTENIFPVILFSWAISQLGNIEFDTGNTEAAVSFWKMDFVFI